MSLFAGILAVIMGFVLGLLGGGGSILTVPILVYALGIDPISATAYSLFVVGTTAAFGLFKKQKDSAINWKIGITFAIPSLIAVFSVRYFLIPRLPDNIIETASFTLPKETFIMLLFTLIMFLAAFAMLRKRDTSKVSELKANLNVPLIALEGLGVGAITGLIGAGGGFLIVPALVLLTGLPIKTAIGTSLLVIAIKSLVGFLGDVGSGQFLDWSLLLSFSVLAIIGMFLGSQAANRTDSKNLRKLFAFFLIGMGIYILFKEF